MDLPDSDFSDVFREFDVERWAGLVRAGSRPPTTPRGGSFPRGKWSGNKVGNISLYLVSPSGSRSFVRSVRRHRAVSILRVGGSFVSKGSTIIAKNGALCPIQDRGS